MLNTAPAHLLLCSGDVAVDEDGLDDKDQLDKSFHKVLESALHTPRKPSVKQREGWAAAGWTRGVVKAKAPRTPGYVWLSFSCHTCTHVTLSLSLPLACFPRTYTFTLALPRTLSL